MADAKYILVGWMDDGVVILFLVMSFKVGTGFGYQRAVVWSLGE